MVYVDAKYSPSNQQEIQILVDKQHGDIYMPHRTMYNSYGAGLAPIYSAPTP